MSQLTAIVRFAPRGPQRRGTGDVESASSLTVNLARRHSLLTATMLSGAISVIEIAGATYPAISKRQGLHSADGHGQYAEALVQRLSVTTGVEDLEGTTCLPWKDMLNSMGHALLHPTRHWCNECLLADVSGQETPYQRFYWCLRPSRHCVHHKTELIKSCPHCKSTQPYFPSLPILSHCNDCGESLLTSPNQPILSDSFEFWKSIYTFELVQQTQRSNSRITHDDFLQWINSICNRYRDVGEVRNLAALTQVDPSNLRRWLKGETKPSLDVLIHFCVSVRCSPASIISKQQALVDGRIVCSEKRARMSKRSRRTSEELESMRQHLERVIARRSVPAPSLKAVARDLGCLKSFLSHRFPEHTRKIRDRAVECRKFRLKQTRMKQKAQLQRAIDVLSSRGLYPSTRHIRQVSGISPNVLATPELQAIITQARQKHLTSLSRSSKSPAKQSSCA